MAFYNNLRKETHEKLNQIKRVYNIKYERVTSLINQLHNHRTNETPEAIKLIEDYFEATSDCPKKLEIALKEYKAAYEELSGSIEFFQKEVIQSEKYKNVFAGVVAGASTTVGAGTATVAPATAVAIASTFGTASTGTAISTLSGAAATSAQMAWLGGGALSAGGGGMAAGQALLALAGPVGITIVATGVIGSGVFQIFKNKKNIKEYNENIKELELKHDIIKIMLPEIRETFNLTMKHFQGIKSNILKLQKDAPNSYSDYSKSQKKMIDVLTKHIQQSTKLLLKQVGH